MRRVALGSVRWLAFSRQGVADAARSVYSSRALSPARTGVYLVAASLFIGVGVTLFRRADLGVPPTDVLLSAIDHATPLSHGQASWVFSGSLILLATVLGERPKVASIFYIVGTGVMVDATYSVIDDPGNDVVRIVFMLVGVLAIVAGVALVVHTTASGGGYEMLGRIAARRGASARVFRTMLEIGVLGVGAVAGGEFGVATVVFALCVGPLLSVMLQALTDHRAGRELRHRATSEPDHGRSGTVVA